MEILDQLSKKKHELDTLKAFNKEIINEFLDNLGLLFIYNSNAIAGNTLTFTETKTVLDGYTIEGKTLNEHLETIGQFDAIHYLFKLIQDDSELNELHIKKIHGLLSNKTNPDNASKYRNITGNEINSFFEWYNTSKNYYHPVEFASRTCGEFLKIHPFINNNNKVARLIMNFEIIKNGYPIIIIDYKHKEQYKNILENTHNTGNYTNLINFIASRILWGFDKYLDLITERKYTDKNYEHKFVL